MARNGRRGGRGLEALRDAFSSANMRALAGITDAGRVLLGRVTAERGDAVEHDSRDVLVRVVDLMTGHALRARLHVPANMLWRKPRADETLAVVVPANANGPAGPVALHGDAGGEGAVPPWYDDKSGLYAPGPVRVESRDDDVEVVADGDVLVLDGTQPFVRGDDFGDAIDAYVDAVQGFAGAAQTAVAAVNTWAGVVQPIGDPTGTATTTLTTALTTTFGAAIVALTAATTAFKGQRNIYLSTRVKGQ